MLTYYIYPVIIYVHHSPGVAGDGRVIWILEEINHELKISTCSSRHLVLSFVFCELFLFCDNSLGKWFGPNISLKHTFRLQDPKALKLFFFNTLTLSTSQKIHINHPSFLDQYFFLTLQVEAFPDFKTCATCLFKDILT